MRSRISSATTSTSSIIFPRSSGRKRPTGTACAWPAAAGYDPLGQAAVQVRFGESYPEYLNETTDHPSSNFRIEDTRDLGEAQPSNPKYPRPAVRAQLRALGY